MHRIVFCLFFLISSAVFAQKKYYLKPSFCCDSEKLIKLNIETVFDDSLKRQSEIERIISEYQSNGFAAITIDSVKFNASTQNVFFSVGNKFNWIKLSKGNNSIEAIRASGFNAKDFKNKPFSFSAFKNLTTRLLQYYENNGYPFASVYLDSIKLSEKEVSGILTVDKKQLFTIDTIRLVGTKVISNTYVESYIDIKKGDFYNQKSINAISSRIRELSFLKQKRDPELIFIDDKVKINIFPDKQNANQFDGVIGFLQNETAGKTTLQLTGDTRLKLLNAFKQAELVDLTARFQPNQSQDLKLNVVYPYLLRLPIGIDARIEIFKRDTSFLDLTRELGFQYLLSGGNYLKVFVRSKNSSLLSTSQYKSITILPSFADINFSSYGLAIRFEKLDYRLNPRKGISFNSSISVGNKRIKKNGDLPSLLYDSLKLESTQYSISLNADYFHPLGRRSTLKIGANNGYIISDQLFENELFRIGGNKDLRGFDELSIPANAFIIGTIEYRYLLEQNSFLFGFVSPAYYENYSRRQSLSSFVYSIGSGISFQTKAGIFSLSYALGKQEKIPLSLQTGKIHFGLISYF